MTRLPAKLRNASRLHIIGHCAAPVEDGYHLDRAIVTYDMLTEPHMCASCYAVAVQDIVREGE